MDGMKHLPVEKPIKKSLKKPENKRVTQPGRFKQAFAYIVKAFY